MRGVHGARDNLFSPSMKWTEWVLYMYKQRLTVP